MKTFQQILAFTLIGILAYLLAVTFLPKYLVSGMNSHGWSFDETAEDLKRLERADILILGSSHAYRTFDPDVAEREGADIFNLATPAQTPMNSYFMFKDFLEGNLTGGRKIRPQVVAIELYWRTLKSNEGLESYVKSISHYPPTMNALRLALEQESVTAFNLFASRLARSAFGLKSRPENLSDGKPYLRNGFFDSTKDRTSVKRRPSRGIAGSKENQDAQIQGMCGDNKDSCMPRKKQVQYIRDIVALARSEKMPVVFVVAPMPDDDLANNVSERDANAVLSVLAKELEVPFIVDFSDAGLDDYEDYEDGSHLNKLGAEKVTREFLRQIRKIPGYSSHSKSSF